MLFGTLPTTHVLRVPGNREVKLIQFAALVFKLVCIGEVHWILAITYEAKVEVDDMGTLHIWDLSTLGNAKLVASEGFAGSVWLAATELKLETRSYRGC